MQLRKYLHACFVVEQENQSLIVDPGNLSTDLEIPHNTCAVVVTHEHLDHVDPHLLGKIAASSPSAVLYTEQSVIDKLNVDMPVQPVNAGDIITAGPFTIEFYGGEHAIIHDDIPRIPNLGVTINQHLCYPGDALVQPPRPPETVIIPVAAPWCKVSEVIDFARNTGAKTLIPTHDAILSLEGRTIYDRVITSNISADINYRRLDRPDGVDLSSR